MSAGYQVKIFLPDGDPGGVRIVHQMNWTGQGIVFPREKCLSVASQRCAGPGIYILIGPAELGEQEDRLYIGEADDVARRFIDHEANKTFWSWAAVFNSTHQGSLNKAHIKWLEHELYDRALKAKRCELENGNRPQKPTMHEAEEADASAFLEKVLQILPLVGLHHMQEPKVVAKPAQTSPTAIPSSDELVLVVPAYPEGFERTFLGEARWHEVRLSGDKLDKIQHCAAYITQPISAITHVAPVDRVESFGEHGKYQLIFSAPAIKLKRPVPFGAAKAGIQGPRYTTLEKLMKANDISEL